MTGELPARSIQRCRVARWSSRALPMAWFVLSISSSPAQAYLDPGTGSILLQVILGAIAAGAAVLVSLRTRISTLLARLSKRRAPDEPASSDDEAKK